MIDALSFFFCFFQPEDLASAVEQNDDPLPASPRPAPHSSSPAPEAEGDEDVVMAAPHDVEQLGGESQESHPSSDEAVENVDRGIGNSGISGIQIDDDSGSEEEFIDEEGSPRMVSIGVQTEEENVPSLSLEGSDRVILLSSVAESEESVFVEDVASDEVEVAVEALPPSPPPVVGQLPPPAPTPLSQTSSQTGESEEIVVVAALEEIDSDVVEAEAGPSALAYPPSPSAGPVDLPLASGLGVVEVEPPAASMEVERIAANAEVNVHEAEEDDDGEESEADRTLVGDVSPSFFKDMSLGNGSAMAMEEGDDYQVDHEQEQRAFGRNEEDVLMASS